MGFSYKYIVGFIFTYITCLDAETVIILREEYEAHDVAGLLKEYFRELPDPLMTEDAYAHFITASMHTPHYSARGLNTAPTLV